MERKVYTVSELTASIKATLEESFPMFWVEGEISNLRMPGSGHAYFTLKDEGAQISAVLFRGRGRRVRFELEDGMQVMASSTGRAVPRADVTLKNAEMAEQTKGEVWVQGPDSGKDLAQKQKDFSALFKA